MSAVTPKVGVVVEVLSSLHLCHASILWPELITKDDVHKVLSSDTSFVVQFTNGSVLTVRSHKSVKFTPGDQEFSIVGNRFISIRLALEAKASVVRSICSDLAIDIRSLSISSPYDVMCNKPLVVSCSSCSAVLSEVVTFDRLRQMPAADWDHAAEEWFCCAHGNAYDKLKPGAVAPKLNDCFFSDLYFLVKENVLSEARHSLDCNANAVCSKCNDIFGVKDTTGVKLWTHRIKWMNHAKNNSVVYSQNVGDILVTLIDNLSADSFGVNSRLVFIKPSTPKMFLYLAVMDINLTILVSPSESPSSKSTVPDCTVTASDDRDSKEIRKDRPKVNNSSKRNKPDIFDEGVAEVTLTKKGVIKVLFRLVTGESKETDGWGDDVNVHLFPCAESLFDALYGGLEGSAAGQSSACQGDMTIGYIHR